MRPRSSMSRIDPVASMYASPRLRVTSAKVWLVSATSNSRSSIVRSVNVSSSALYATTDPAIVSEKVKCILESIDSDSSLGSVLLRDQNDDATALDGAALGLERGLLPRLGDVG